MQIGQSLKCPFKLSIAKGECSPLPVNVWIILKKIYIKKTTSIFRYVNNIKYFLLFNT